MTPHMLQRRLGYAAPSSNPSPQLTEAIAKVADILATTHNITDPQIATIAAQAVIWNGLADNGPQGRRRHTDAEIIRLARRTRP